jgi:hypothetical protein
MIMNAHALTLVAFGLVLVPRSALLAQYSEEQQRAMAEIKTASGWVGVDENRPGKPVIRVGLDGAPSPSTKWGLWVKAFPQLEEFSAC